MAKDGLASEVDVRSQPTLNTKRLRLRPLCSADAPSIQRLASDRSISDTMISIPYPYPKHEAERYVARQQTAYQQGHAVTFVIETKLEASFSGLVEVREIEHEHAQAELSFWLAVQLWGQGYMSEALAPVVRFSFQHLGLNRLYAHHMVRNPACGRVLARLGFAQEGLLRQRVRKWGVFEDVRLHALLRRDWARNPIF